MIITVLHELVEWLRYIQETSGVHVMIYGLNHKHTGDEALEEALLPHLWHINPYCLFIKKERVRWDYCIRAKRVLFADMKASGRECVSCHCPFGVYEKNWPVIVRGRMIGTASVAYRGEPKEVSARIERMGARYGFDTCEARELYERAHLPRGDGQIAAECQLPMVAHALSALAADGRVSMAPEAGGQHELVDRATEYIFVHASEPLAVTDICAHLNVSESHLQHLFKRIRGQSMVATIADIRLGWARRLLLEGQLSVREIAERCGFSDPNYFSTVFSRRYGAPPKTYKKRNAGR